MFVTMHQLLSLTVLKYFFLEILRQYNYEAFYRLGGISALILTGLLIIYGIFKMGFLKTLLIFAVSFPATIILAQLPPPITPSIPVMSTALYVILHFILVIISIIAFILRYF